MNTNRVLTVVLVVVVVALIALAIAYLASRPAVAPTPGETDNGADSGELEGEVMDNGDGSLEAYFQERMNSLGLEALDAMPIEGFDAQLLLGAFPGLTAADFDGVEAFEGHYEFRSGSLNFVRGEPQPVSSAERTVSAEGYGTLLANVADRLEVEVISGSDVDALIQQIRS